MVSDVAGKRILLVEDEALIALMEQRQLAARGYRVETVASGEAAVRRACADPDAFDLILMDIDLGDGLDGIEAAASILARQDTPIVFLSSHTEAEVVDRTERLTSYGYVVKNSGIVVLDASIKMAFKLHDSNRRLARKEADYRILFENSINAVGLHEIVLGEDGRPVDYVFLQVNAAFEAHTGLRASEIINRPVTAVLPGIEKSGLIETYGRVATTGQSIKFESYIEAADRHFTISAFPAGPGRFAAVFENVTERKRADLAMRESEAKYRAMFDNINVGIALHEIVLDEGGRPVDFVYLDANPAYEAMTGLKAADIVGRRGSAVNPGLERKWIELYGRVALSGRPAEIEERSAYQGNHWEVKAYSPKPGQFAVAMTNITERKRVERELKLNEARLAGLARINQYPAASIQDLLDYALNEAIALTDSRIGYIKFYDEAERRFTGDTWSKEAKAACAVAESEGIYGLDRSGIWGEAVRQRRAIVVNDFAAPNPLKRGLPDGHVALAKFMTIPVFDRNEIVAVVGVANKSVDYDESDMRQLQLMMDDVWKVTLRQRGQEKLRDLLAERVGLPVSGDPERALSSAAESI